MHGHVEVGLEGLFIDCMLGLRLAKVIDNHNPARRLNIHSFASRIMARSNTEHMQIFQACSFAVYCPIVVLCKPTGTLPTAPFFHASKL